MALHLFNVPFHFPLPPEKPPNRPVKSTGKTRTVARKSLLKPTLLTILTIITLYSFSNTFLFPTPVPPNPPLLSHHSHPFSGDPTVFRHPSPAKIFLYDLPRKFTHGVIESYLAARDSLAKPVDDSKLKYPGNQHSAEWFLFSDLINPNRFDSHVVRVSDPEKADLFYVPFFSSLSLVVNPIRAVNFGSGGIYSDEEMQEGLMEWLEGKVYWKRKLGRDHVFVCQDPNALYRVIDRVKNSVLLVSDFGRLRGDQAGLVKDVILPYSHRINSYNGEVGVEGRNSLLFFMGNRYRKEGGKIRDLLFQILENQEDVIVIHGAQSRESRRMATQGMHSSKFCLHPAGDTPSACRLFDAIVSLCVPVIVSDHIELPFEDVIDYKKIAIFLDSATAVRPGYLVSMLRELSTERILQYQMELKMIQAVIKKYDILFIADEVVCAFGRLGTMFGCDKYNIKPDLVTVAKALSSAYLPIGGVLVSPEITEVINSQSDKLGSFSHGFTYSGHPVPCAVALEALKIYKERNIVDHVQSLGKRFQDGIRTFSESPIIGEIRVSGLILGTEFTENKTPTDTFPSEWGIAAYFEKECKKRGMLVRYGGDIVMMCPPLITTPEEIDKIISIYGEALKSTEERVKHLKSQQK